MFVAQPSLADEDPEDRIAALNILSEGCCLDDVVGDHNPRMIAIWAGDLTRTDWYLRYERSSCKYITLRNGLYAYYALHGRFPNSLTGLDSAGLFPISPLDPVTGLHYAYGIAPLIPEDYLCVGIQASRDNWLITTTYPKLPDGTYSEYTDDVFNDFFSFDEEYAKWCMSERVENYPNDSAMCGYHLASQLSYVLSDYIRRRNHMPDGTEDLLDGLWAVRESWAEPDTEIDMSEPGSFMFGVDEGYEIAFVKWFDLQGGFYSHAWSWSPWPDDGWDHVPTWEEYEGRFNRDTFGWGITLNEDFDLRGFIPSTVLWHCIIEVD